jgi:hypothetical protein
MTPESPLMVPRPRAMGRRLHSASVGVFSTSGDQVTSDLWPGAGRAVSHPKLHHSEPQRGAWWKGTPEPWAWDVRILARCGRGAATEGTAVDAPWLRECTRVHCMGPCLGSVRPCSLAQKVGREESFDTQGRS